MYPDERCAEHPGAIHDWICEECLTASDDEARDVLVENIAVFIEGLRSRLVGVRTAANAVRWQFKTVRRPDVARGDWLRPRSERLRAWADWLEQNGIATLPDLLREIAVECKGHHDA